MKAETVRDRSAPAQPAGAAKLWFVPHEYLSTSEAEQRALAIISWTTTGEIDGEPPQTEEVFVAFHVCAHHATEYAQRNSGTDCAMPPEQQAWIDRWQKLRDYLVDQNLGLAYTMVGRFRNLDLDHDDLVSEALYALSRAVDRFNPWRGFKFSTYACNVVTRALMRLGKLETKHRRIFPTQAEMPVEEYHPPEITEGIYVERLRRAMDKNLGSLTELESEVIRHRFPKAENSEPMTFREIGRVIGLSKERVRQIQNVALGKLRDALRRDKVLQ